MDNIRFTMEIIACAGLLYIVLPYQLVQEFLLQPYVFLPKRQPTISQLSLFGTRKFSGPRTHEVLWTRLLCILAGKR